MFNPAVAQVPAAKPLSGNSQCARILVHLRNGKTITALEALGVFGCFNLKGRIFDLKKRGHNIFKVMKQDATGKRYASYRLIREGGIGQ